MLEIRPLAPEIGAEVTGFDMGKPLTDSLFEEIQAAWMHHKVLVCQKHTGIFGCRHWWSACVPS